MNWLTAKDRLLLGLLGILAVGMTSFVTYTIVSIADLKTTTAVLQSSERAHAEWLQRIEIKIDKVLESL